MNDIYDDIPCIYFSALANGSLINVNNTLCNYLGYEKSELLDSKLEKFFTLSTRIFQQTHLYPLLEIQGHAKEIYITLLTKNGEHLPILINAERIDNDGDFFYQFAGVSVNNRKKFEEEIIAAKKVAEKALNENEVLKATKIELEKNAEQLDYQIALFNNQNEDLRQFTHLATHTLQEPIRKLMLYSGESSLSNNNEIQFTSPQKIRKAVEELNNKLNGLQQYLWLTKDGMEIEQVDLGKLIYSIKQEIVDVNPGINILLELELMPTIDGNKEQLHFLITELFKNAVKFRKQENLVEIEITHTSLLLNKFKQLTGKYKYASYIKIEFKDLGIGIDENFNEQVFELFRVLKPDNGLGIGLSLSKKIIENHNGSISIEAKKGQYTKFVIQLPLNQ